MSECGCCYDEGGEGEISGLLPISESSEVAISISDSYAGRVLATLAGTDVTITFPSGVTDTSFGIIRPMGAGRITFAAGGGVVLRAPGSPSPIRSAARYGDIYWHKIAAGEYVLNGMVGP
ncbi:MAG: hypothetical protein KIT41_14225 [Pyrinomonadaceae bacterium]|nr:hypothetical protein [Pyrinomonadaceae bacterium]